MATRDDSGSKRGEANGPTAGSTPSASAAELSAAEAMILEATRIAWGWHGRDTRKGRSTSYMSHLLAVQGLVIQAGGGPQEAIAALLHDSLEDAASPADRRMREDVIASRFGEDVFRIVLECTDTKPEETGASKGPWRERKLRYLAQLRSAAAASRLVAACDKRHNLGDLVWDLRHEGPETLHRFNAGAADQLWYFESMSKICRGAIPPRLAEELDGLVSAFRTLTDPRGNTERDDARRSAAPDRSALHGEDAQDGDE
jgi:(p)ppGpp synthase/HD superfamily hydrolase